ncbi:MAG: tRNA pseudouridine(55) synthase TruB [Xanthomonadales bacterium]|nr:tRNA pseudouridine(55) synthase TruB [Xanthomonadales bacterium]
MGRRRNGRDVHGVLLLDKPAGLSSNQAVQKIRWLFQARKAGHTGTLDPFATGLLPVCLGEASKTAAFMLDADKTYQARARLGIATETGDIEGAVVLENENPPLDRDSIDSAMEAFRGTIEQVPPMYSALKHEGKPLYKLAREGKEVARAPRSITIHRLEVLSWHAPDLEFRVRCSKGTYVRTLAEDLAASLGTCAHLRELRRTASGCFDSGMVSLETVVATVEQGKGDDLLLPPDAGLTDWPRIDLVAPAAIRFSHGNPVDAGTADPGMIRVYGPENHLLGLGEVTGQALKPRRVMNLQPANN